MENNEHYHAVMWAARRAGLYYVPINTHLAPAEAAYIIDNIDMPGFTPAQKKLLSALLFNQRDDFKLDTLEKQGAVTGRQAIRLARILRPGGRLFLMSLVAASSAVPHGTTSPSLTCTRPIDSRAGTSSMRGCLPVM